MRTALVLACTILALSAPRLDAQWRMTSLDLDVTVRPATRTLVVAGTARVVRGAAATPPSADGPVLVFGPDGVAFDSVRVTPAARVAFSARRDSVLVRDVRDSALTVTFLAHADRDIGRNQIRDSGAMISWGALWYPLIAWAPDAGPALEVPGTTRLTVPARWHTLSPGTLVDSTVTDGLRIERWRVTRPTARSFVAAEFAPVTTRVDATRVSVYLLPRHAARMGEYAAAIPRMVRVLSTYFGPYPFDTFGIAELPREVAPFGFGGRSEPGYFIAHTDALDGAGINVPLFAHELTHMWFPNAVDSRPPGDDMMDEAIADYGAAVYREATEGAAAARRALVDADPSSGMRAYFHESRRGTDAPLMTDYGYGIARAKGPMVYDMLRRRIGDPAFFGVWRDLAARGGSASLADLRRLYLARVPGDTGLATFLAQWMDRTGAPIVVADTARRGGALGLTLMQRGTPYVLDVPLRVHGRGGARDTVVRLARAMQSFSLGAATRVEIDPDDQVLLWKPRFGPPPDAPASWPTARWRAWLDDEIAWLMRGYEVRGVHVTVVRDGATAWTGRYGTDAPDVAALARTHVAALADSLRVRRSRGDTSTVQRLVTTGDDVTLLVGRPTERVGVVVVARGGWGGRQLTMHVAQRVAIQDRWRRVPE